MVGHPVDRPVPGASEWTTANPNGTQARSWEFDITGLVFLGTIVGGLVLSGGSEFNS